MEALSRFGFSPYQCRLYASLVRLGSATAHELARDSGVPYTAVYQNMDALVKRQICYAEEGRTRRFVANEPKGALLRLAEEESSELRAAATEASDLLLGISPERSLVPVSFSTGIARSHADSMRSFAEATRRIHVLGWAFKSSSGHAVLRAAAKRAKEGLDVRIITGNERLMEREAVRLACAAGVQVRYAVSEGFSFVLVDGKRCKITLKGEALPERVNVHVQDDRLATALDAYFMSLWKQARPL